MISKKTGWARHVSTEGESKIAQSFSHKNIRGQPLRKAINDRIKIIKRTLKKQGVRVWNGFICRERYHRSALRNTLMKIRLPQNAGHSSNRLPDS
jgi:hypothetical protein